VVKSWRLWRGSLGKEKIRSQNNKKRGDLKKVGRYADTGRGMTFENRDFVFFFDCLILRFA